MRVQLVPIAREGSLPDGFPELTSDARDAVTANVAMYERTGFVLPWIAYLAHAEDAWAGTCAFAAPAAGGRVEMAYWTFAAFEGRGVATSMAAALVALAGTREPGIVVTAQTLPRESASTRVLSKLGFLRGETVQHPDEGPVWEWTRQAGFAPR